jgi:hypothetical protein
MTPDETGDAECRGHYTDTVVCVGSGCNKKDGGCAVEYYRGKALVEDPRCSVAFN